MDLLFFFKERTSFIQRYYKAAETPFRETMRRIEVSEAPFETTWNEDGEPPFLGEWVEARDSLGVLGLSCVSMLSASLKLYFSDWERELRIEWAPGERRRLFKSGILLGFRSCFERVTTVSWEACPADLDLVEQVVLARNRDQHPDSITSMSARYNDHFLDKHPSPFFVDDAERVLFADLELGDIPWLKPKLHVSREALYNAIDESRRLAEWIEDQLLTVC